MSRRTADAHGRTAKTDTAYYCPAPYWLAEKGDWIKSLLLFFDEVAILLPDYMRGRHRDADPSLAGPLEDQGLLRVLEPKEWIDTEVVETLVETMVELLTKGVFDELPDEGYFAELPQSRIGYGADVELAGSLVEELQPSHYSLNYIANDSHWGGFHHEASPNAAIIPVSTTAFRESITAGPAFQPLRAR